MCKWVKTMERVKILESNTEESLGIWEAVCMKSVVSELERPYLSPKGKDEVYKLGEVTIMTGGSRRGT